MQKIRGAYRWLNGGAGGDVLLSREGREGQRKKEKEKENTKNKGTFVQVEKGSRRNIWID